uniref:Cytochrome c oxidase subunit 3 n=1 Tax=Postharmostomum commutatum TaxID=2336775 RepID=A0A5C1D5T2_9TREM|nr:cytochrome c oxidase subunit 3 [Postharmostomum commutatum]QEL51319.1 cytochrome c oxidase subunit 3 [Postharmostomum commutatum]
MSWLSLVSALIIGYTFYNILLLGGQYSLSGLVLFVLCVLFIIKEAMQNKKHFLFAFLIFLLVESVVFFTLFYGVLSTLWDAEDHVASVAEWSTLPLMSSAMLLGSSVLMSVFHANAGLRIGRLWYVLGLLLGIGFIVLQFYELKNNPFSGISFSYGLCCILTVAFHYLHVIIGVVVLIVVFFVMRSIPRYYVDCAVWYWHYVDAMWLLVFLCVYVFK